MKKTFIRFACLAVALCAAVCAIVMKPAEAKATAYNYVSKASFERMVKLAEDAYATGKPASYFDGGSPNVSHCALFAYGYCVRTAMAGDGLSMPKYGYPHQGIYYLLKHNYGKLFIKCSTYHASAEEALYNQYINKSECDPDNVVIADETNFDGPKRGDLAIMGWSPGSTDHVVIMTSPSACVYGNLNEIVANPMTGQNAIATFDDGKQHYYGTGVMAYFRFNTTPPFSAIIPVTNWRTTEVPEVAVGQGYSFDLYYEDETLLEGVSTVTANIYYSPTEDGEFYLYRSEEIPVKQEGSTYLSMDATDIGYYTGYFRIGNVNSARATWRVRDVRTVVSSTHGSNAYTQVFEEYDENENIIGYRSSTLNYFTTGETIRLSLNTSEFTSARIRIAKISGGYKEYVNEVVDPNNFTFTIPDDPGSYQCNFVDVGTNQMRTQSIDLHVESHLDFPVSATLDGSTVYLSWPDMGVGENGYCTIWAEPRYQSYQFAPVANMDHTSAQIHLPVPGLWYFEVACHKGQNDVLLGKVYVVLDADTVSFDANGGTGAPITQTAGTGDVTVPEEEPSRPGYAFLGWSTTAGASAPSYQPGDTYTGDGSATLYAVWDKLNPDFILPANTVSVEEYAFQGCAFTYVKLSDATETLGSGAFAGCPNLKHVYMPPNTVEIGSGVFPAGVTIHGQSGSYAEFYAESNGYGFIVE